MPLHHSQRQGVAAEAEAMQSEVEAEAEPMQAEVEDVARAEDEIRAMIRLR